MNQNIILAMAIIAIAISIGTLAATSSTTDTNPQTGQTLIELKTADEELWNQFVSINESTISREGVLQDMIHGNIELIMKLQEKHEILTPQITELQAAINTTNENFIELPEKPSQRETLNLIVTDLLGNEKEVFRINDPVIITGDHPAPGEKIKYTIWSPSGVAMAWGGYILNPLTDKYYVSWLVPGDREIGTYSVTFSDSEHLDSITFKVK